MPQKIMIRLSEGSSNAISENPAHMGACERKLLEQLQAAKYDYQLLTYREENSPNWSRGSTHTYLITIGDEPDALSKLQKTLGSMIVEQEQQGYAKTAGREQTLDMGGGMSLRYPSQKTEIVKPLKAIEEPSSFAGEIRDPVSGNATQDTNLIPDLVIKCNISDAPPQRRRR
jgi:hypothetical protein